jgi:hypothetical protein
MRTTDARILIALAECMRQADVGQRVDYLVVAAAQRHAVPALDVATAWLAKLVACARARASEVAMDEADAVIDTQPATFLPGDELSYRRRLAGAPARSSIPYARPPGRPARALSPFGSFVKTATRRRRAAG